MANRQSSIAVPLLSWFEQHGRKNLPWQQQLSAYRVWLSEIMLQQTQVATVIPYFEKFICHFPSIDILAKAELDEVLHLWTGLGYYARARNLHRTAIIITQQYQCQFPTTLRQLIALPGIGRSTAGAILSIAFEQSAPILDGNVKRVLCRYYAIEGQPQAIEKDLWQLAATNTPQKNCRQYTQAIMDLGATVCTRSNPQCHRCPLTKHCIAYKEERVQELPVRATKQKLPVKTMRFLVMSDQDKKVLLERRPLDGLWGGLWSFPQCSVDNDIGSYCEHTLKVKITGFKEGSPFRHTFSHFHLDITPIFIRLEHKCLQVSDEALSSWWHPDELPKIGLSAPVKKLLLGLASGKDLFGSRYGSEQVHE